MATASNVVLGTAATGAFSGTIFNVNAGTFGGVNLSLNVTNALGTAANEIVNLNNKGTGVVTLTLGAIADLGRGDGHGEHRPRGEHPEPGLH